MSESGWARTVATACVTTTPASSPFRLQSTARASQPFSLSVSQLAALPPWDGCACRERAYRRRSGRRDRRKITAFPVRKDHRGLRKPECECTCRRNISHAKKREALLLNHPKFLCCTMGSDPIVHFITAQMLCEICILGVHFRKGLPLWLFQAFRLKAPKGRRYTDGGKRSAAPGSIKYRSSPERATEDRAA